MKKLLFLLTALCFMATNYQAKATDSKASSFLPKGSYMVSCVYCKMNGDTLICTCRKADRSWNPTQLDKVSQCTGSIKNLDGCLVCTNN